MSGQHEARILDPVIIMVIQGAVGRAIADAQGGLIGSRRMVRGLMQAVAEGHDQGTQELLARGVEPAVIAEVLHRHGMTLPDMLHHALVLLEPSSG